MLVSQMQQNENHNHKPVFSNCSNYAPVVKEEEPVGTVVIKVHAEDRDHPDDGGTRRVNISHCDREFHQFSRYFKSKNEDTRIA